MRPYILKDHIPVEVEDGAEAFRWRDANWQDCTVGKTYIGHIEVSTVFLILDHSFGMGRPILFETMVFGFDDWVRIWVSHPKDHRRVPTPKPPPPPDRFQERYSSWDEAQKGHDRMVAQIKAWMGY